MKFFFIFFFCFLFAKALEAQVIIQAIEVTPKEQANLVYSQLPFQLGDEFDPKYEAISKRLLIVTEKYEKVDVRWIPETSTYAVNVMPRLFFEDVEWAGDDVSRMGDVQQVCVSRYEPRAISQERVSQIVQCLQREIRGLGYLDAQVSIDTSTPVLKIGVSSGGQYRIEKISFIGIDRIKMQTLLDSIVNKAGRPFLPSEIDNDTKKILKIYFKEGFYFAEVLKPSLQVDPKTHKVQLSWRIKEAYPMDIRFTGHRKSRKLLYEFIDREQTFPKWFLDEIRDTMNSQLRDEGYLKAEVKLIKNLKEDGTEDIEINTRLRQVFHLVEPEWVGIANVSDVKRIYSKVADIQPGDSYEDINYRKILSEDFESRLFENGYLDAKIRNVDFILNNEKFSAKPIIYMNEGPQYRIESSSIEGLTEQISEHQELKDLRNLIRENDVFNLVEFDRLRKDFQRTLSNEGYLDAVVDGSFERTSQGVAVKVKVNAGPRYKVAKVLIRGAIKTDYDVIRREVNLARGDYFEDEAVKDSVSQVLRLGIARSVDIQVLEKDVEAGEVYVLVDLQEASRFRFELGPGYGTIDGVRGVFKATYANIGGTARRLTLYSKASRRLESESTPDPAEYLNPESTPFIQRRISIEYFEPSLFTLPIDGRLTFTHFKEEKSRFGEKRGFVAAVDYRLSRHWIFTTAYELAFSDPFNIKIPAAPGDADSKRFTSIGEAIVMDYLDDSFNPSKGFRTRWGFDIFDSRLGGEEHFWQASMRQEVFSPLFVIKKRKMIGFALNFGLGFSESYSPSEEVPVEKRSEIGGETTVRAYGQRAINPKAFDGLERDGGNSYFFFQTELNIPIIAGFDLLGFFDGGNAYLTNKDFRPWDLRYGAGPGVRWNTPVGPLKIGYGFIIQREKDEPVGHLFIGVGAI